MCTSAPVTMSSLPRDNIFKAVSLFNSWQYSCEGKRTELEAFL